MSYDYIDPLSLPPEEMKPDGMVAILVGVTRHGEFNYYVLPRHLVYLDATNDDGGAALYAGLEGRFGIMTVDEAHEDAYFRGIEPYKRSVERLQLELRACKKRLEWVNYATQVLIDFDQKHLLSYFCEPYYFENSVPPGWSSERKGIYVPGDYFTTDDGPDGLPPDSMDTEGPGRHYIPLDKRFWIDENGKSICKMI